MVQGIPYVHWKINSETSIYNDVDTNYLWATVVEANKGPTNTPILCASNADVLKLFGVDLSAYFAQGARYLVVVRAAAQTDENKLKNAWLDIKNSEDFTYTKVAQPYYVTEETYEFTSYPDANAAEQPYATGKVKLTGKTSGTYTQVEVITNTPEYPGNEFARRKLFIESSTQTGQLQPARLYESTESDELGEPIDVWVKINTHNASMNNGLKKYVQDGTEKVYVKAMENSSMYQECDENTGELKNNGRTYAQSQVTDEKIAEEITIPAETPLIHLECKFPGNYDIELVILENLIYKGYNITLTETGAGYVAINNANDLLTIVNKINNQNLSVKATLTPEGQEISDVIRSSPVMSTAPYSDVAIGQILAPAEGTKYVIKLQEIEHGSVFNEGSNGEWDDTANRINSSFAAEAHQKALDSLMTTRIAGVFCLYGEDDIQREYLLHGEHPSDAYKGTNSNLVCKWRYILLGANEFDRQDLYTLMAKPQSINNQYVLFLGQGLVDGDNILPPYMCTPYIAGLRAKLNYGESIFGGQSRKTIMPVNNDLKIAPLFQYEDDLEILPWEPLVYEQLNEAGVLTFTTDYGRLTLTDGVTTSQDYTQQSEEGVVNIIKYVQNGVQSLCTQYIGRNVNADLQAALEMNIKSFLETMTSSDQTLVDLPAENIKAYEVEVTMSSNSQVIGKIFVNLKITPVHALRQIEIEMTVQ